MIKTTIQKLLTTKHSMEMLIAKDFDMKKSWEIVKLIQACDVELLAFEKLRDQLLKKYELTIETLQQDITDPVIIENKRKLNSDIKALLDNEISLNINKIEIDVNTNINIAPGVLLALSDFITILE